MQLPRFMRQVQKYLFIALIIAIAIPAASIFFSRIEIARHLEALKSNDLSEVAAAEDALACCRRPAEIRVIIAAYDDGAQDSRKLTDVLARIGPPAAAPLVDELSRDPRPWYQLWWKKITGRGDPDIPKITGLDKRSSITTALAMIGPPAVAPLLAKPPADDTALFGLAAEVFERMGTVAVPGLLEGLKGRNAHSRELAALGLSMLDDPRTVGPLTAAAQDPAEDGNVRFCAACALGKQSDPKAFDAILAILAGTSTDSRSGAAAGLYHQKDPRTVDVLVTLVSDRNPRVRDSAISSLSTHKDARTTKALVATIAQSDPIARPAAIDALVTLKDPAAIEQLIDAGNAGPEAATHSACIALEILGDDKGLVVIDRYLTGVNIDYVARNYKAYIERGDPSAVWILIIALEYKGDARMARDFWLCGQRDLQFAGSSLVIRRMLPNVLTLDNTVPHTAWGSNRAATLPVESTAVGPSPRPHNTIPGTALGSNKAAALPIESTAVAPKVRPSKAARTIDDYLPATK